jgi:hypothetical protein
MDSDMSSTFDFLTDGIQSTESLLNVQAKVAHLSLYQGSPGQARRSLTATLPSQGEDAAVAGDEDTDTHTCWVRPGHRILGH